MKILATALLLSASQPQSIELPAWLAGAWVTAPSDGEWTEEWWSTARGGIMLGASRSGEADRFSFFEHARIVRTATGVEFCAMPQGKSGGCFPAVSSTAGEIVFENLQHDYPTRIVYRRSAGGISAEISGPKGARRQSWHMIPLSN